MIPRQRPSFSLAELEAAAGPGRDARGRFEEELAAHFGMTDAVVFPYGRSAIHAALTVLAPAGTKVVQPAYNCVVVSHATMVAGLEPVFVDTGPGDPNQDPEQMAAAVGDDTSVVIPTSIFGLNFDAKGLIAAIRERNPRALIMVDCCQGFDATWQGEMMARQGDVAILAFGLGKPMTTLFGGALLTRRRDLAHRVRRYRDETSRARGAVEIARRYLYFLASWVALTAPFVRLTDWLEAGDTPLRRYLMTLRSRETIGLPEDNDVLMMGMEAAVGRRQLQRLGGFTERRRAIGRVYRERLRDLEGLELVDGGEESSEAIYVARVKEPAIRPRVLAAMRRAGVQGGTVLDYVIPALPCYRAAGFDPAPFPRSLGWAASVVNFPNHPTLSDGQVDRVVRAVRSALGG